MQITERYDYMDATKAFAIFLVVAGHVLALCFSDNMTSCEDMVIWKFIYSFHMPLFMFVSGFVCFAPNKHYKPSVILKRIVSYMLPFFTMALILGLFRNNIDFSTFWYLRTLSIFVLILYISKFISKVLIYIYIYIRRREIGKFKI